MQEDVSVADFHFQSGALVDGSGWKLHTLLSDVHRSLAVEESVGMSVRVCCGGGEGGRVVRRGRG